MFFLFWGGFESGFGFVFLVESGGFAPNLGDLLKRCLADEKR